MFQSSFNEQISLEIKPSIQKGLIVAIPHLLALVLVVSLSVFLISVKIILSLLILVSAFYYTRKILLNSLNKSVIQVFQGIGGNWKIIIVGDNKKNEPFSVDMLQSSYISQWIIILNLIDDDQSQYRVVITPDSITNQEYRILYSRINLLNIESS